MTQQFVLADQEQRQRIATSLDESLFVEAGAGTGKTTELVARAVALIASGKAEMGGIAAITFTEAAAAELRERVRRELEKESLNAKRSAEERKRCARAVREMESAAIQTLHSFAAALLRERPLEAGLPPVFEVVEEIEADIQFEETWQQWLDKTLESAATGPHLQRALGLGLRLEDLRQVAVILHQNYDLVTASFTAAPAPQPKAVAELLRAEGIISRLLPQAKNGLDDPLAAHASKVLALSHRLRPLGQGDSAIAQLARSGRLSFAKGRIQDWTTDPATRINGCTALKNLLRDLEEARTQELGLLREAVLSPLLESIRGFVVAQGTERKSQGRAEFHDLLIWARDLLRDNSEARAHFQRRFSHLLVDEFQDTDPIQAEIAFFLAGRPEDAASLQSREWRKVKTAPGKLFVVGDPKQSIYRFRRADIAALDEVRRLLGQDPVPLAQNFRSQEGIIAWVNHVFSQWMGDGQPGVQAQYIPLSPRWSPPAASPPLGVHRMGTAMDAPAEEVREHEARAIVALVQEIRDTRWQVRKEVSGPLDDASYQDICLLFPTRTGLPALEQALDDANVPYRIESQSLVLGTQDVRDMLNCLRAIDSPADQVAVVAALRSSAFGCSDVELLQFVEAGGRFDYSRPGATSGPVAEAFKVLLEYHQRRTWDNPDELIERFIRDRKMVEASFGRARPRERWRRLRFVVERARAFIHAGGSSLRAYLDWMERQADEGARTIEVPVPETDEDAVRIMTIHASKGLEFPIAILAGLGSPRRNRSGQVLVDRGAGSAEVSLRALGNDRFETQGFDAAKQREGTAEEAEAARLAYVAATRARDHLVVSLFRPSVKGADRSHAATLEQFCSSKPDLWREVGIRTSRGAATAAPQPQPSVDDFATRRAVWQAQRDAAVEAASRPEAEAVTTIARVAKEEAEGGEIAYRRGRGGTNLGRAVHGVLQSIDLATGSGLVETSKAQAGAEGIPERWEEVAQLVRTALESGVVKRAVNTGRYHREVFVSIPLNGRFIEGFIDLLFEDDGGLVIVDYKTDSVDAADVETAKGEHEVQAGLYALAARQVTGKPVRQAVLLFLHPNAEYTFTDMDALITKARGAALTSVPGTSTESPGTLQGKV
ncbi:MAG: UvrD-helicase domain-containing protein [Chloroflexota bacterium]|nr:UvrD-helicase domain-containing protein [Chloroflexota bacterium]